MIYLDNAATTYPKPEIVYSTMDKFLREQCVSAGRGSYNLARENTKLIDDTRKLLLELINSNENGKVIFTSSATIAINQVLRGLPWNDIHNVYISPFEHNAIMRTLHSLKKIYNFNLNVIPFDNLSFELDEDRLKVMFAKNNPDLLVLSHISNVTGFILPIQRCHELANQYNPINIVDCAQSLGIVNVDAETEFSLCDFIIFAGHKSLYGPLGIGGFIQLSNKVRLNEVITGGTGSDSTDLDMPTEDEKRYEAGSYNIYAVAGFNIALKWIINTDINKINTKEKELTNFLIEGLKEVEGIEIYLPEDIEKHMGPVAFNIVGFLADEVGKILDSDFNVCVRTGHHCAPYVGEFLDGQAKEGTVRVSVGYFNNLEEIKCFIANIKEIAGD